MNNQAIMAKGSQYVESAISNWITRKEMIIKYYYDPKMPEKQKKKIHRIVTILQERVFSLWGLYVHQRDQQALEKAKAENEYVILECSNFECRYSDESCCVGVKVKDYTPGKLRCETCGAELRTREDISVDDMLFELGVRVT